MTIVESSRILTTTSNFERSGIELAAILPSVGAAIIIKFGQSSNINLTACNIIELSTCIQCH